MTNSQDVSFVVPPNVAAAVTRATTNEKHCLYGLKRQTNFKPQKANYVVKYLILLTRGLLLYMNLCRASPDSSTHMPFSCAYSTVSLISHSTVTIFPLLTETSFIACFPFASNKVKKLKCTLVQAPRLCTGRTVHRGSTGIPIS